MNEELEQKLTDRFEAISAKAECDNEVRDALLKAYLAGGEYGYQYAKKRLSKVLGFELDFNVAEFDDGVTTESLVDKICKRIEE